LEKEDNEEKQRDIDAWLSEKAKNYRMYLTTLLEKSLVDQIDTGIQCSKETEFCVRKTNNFDDDTWKSFTHEDIRKRLDFLLQGEEENGTSKTLRYWVHTVPMTSSDSEEILITQVHQVPNQGDCPRKSQERKKKEDMYDERIVPCSFPGLNDEQKHLIERRILCFS
jgi:hypothetical protein